MAAKRFCIVLATAAAVAWSVSAAASPSACQIPAQEGHPLADRTEVLAQYERLPKACLEQIVLQCSAAARESLLDLGSAAICSIGYEALLSAGFGGSYPALLSWWRTQRSSLGGSN